MKLLHGVVAAVVLVVMTPWAVAQREYASESRSWSFTSPAGWNPIGFEVIKGIEAQVRAEYPDKTMTYIAGFTKGPMNTLVYPRILVNKTDVDLTGVKLEDVEFGLTLRKATNERELAIGDLVYSFVIGEGTLDRSKMRVVSTAEDTNDKGEEVTFTVYGYFGKNYLIQFECVDLKSNGDRNAGAFAQFVNTFSMREDAKWKPLASGEKGVFDDLSTTPFKAERTSSSSGGGYRLRRFGLGGGLLVLVVLGVLKILIRD